MGERAIPCRNRLSKKRWSGRVSRILYRRGFTGKRPVADLGGGDHSSRPAVARRLEHPTRSLGMVCVESETTPLRSQFGSSALAIHRDGPPLAAYLGLLAVGFTLPRPSPVARCALTAPFHPYRRKRRKIETRLFRRFLVSTFAWRCLFCGTFPRLAPGWRYQPPHPVQFGLSSRRLSLRAIAFAHSTDESLYVLWSLSQMVWQGFVPCAVHRLETGATRVDGIGSQQSPRLVRRQVAERRFGTYPQTVFCSFAQAEACGSGRCLGMDSQLRCSSASQGDASRAELAGVIAGRAAAGLDTLEG